MTTKAHVDEEIIQHAALESVYSPCTCQRDTPSPAHCLSVETLQTIFLQCAHDGYMDSFHESYELGVPGWANISYVCSHWRAVALNCPAFWAYHFVASLRWTEELLVRSWPVPLKISIVVRYGDSRFWSGLLEKLMDHGERIQQLRLKLNMFVMDTRRIHPKSPLCLPKLQHLEISSVNDNSWYPVALFDGSTPALRVLEFDRCLVVRCPSKLAGLTTLSLRLPGAEWGMPRLLDVLRETQNLAYLNLDHTVSSDRETTPSDTEPPVLQGVKLPRLLRLSVCAPALAAIPVLSFLDFPLKTKVKLSCFTKGSNSREDYTELPFLLAQRFTTFKDEPSPTVRSLTLEFDELGPKLILSVSERVCHPLASSSIVDWDHNVLLQLFLGVDYGCYSMVTDICRAIPLTAVESAHIIHPPSSWPVFWRDMFRYLPGLRYMKLSQGDIPNLVSLYSDQHGGGGMVESVTAGADDRGHPVLWALDELELYRIMFPVLRSRGGDLLAQRTTPSRRALFDALGSICPTRHVRLVMIRCAVKKRSMLNGPWSPASLSDSDLGGDDEIDE